MWTPDGSELKPGDPFIPLFERAGYTLTYDAKGRCYDGMVRLAGGDLNALRFLRDAHTIRLFSNAQVRKGRAFSYRELLGIAQPGAPARVNHFADQTRSLVDRHIWLRGYNVRCPLCDLEAWYDLAAAAGGVCQGCRSPLSLALELPFAFRLNPLFVEGLKQGALTVLLTAILLASSGDVTWKAGCQVSKGALKADIDLIALNGESGTLTLAECKDNIASKSPDDLRAQLERGMAVARDLDARFVFATLRESLPDAAAGYLKANGVRAITQSELLNQSNGP